MDEATEKRVSKMLDELIIITVKNNEIVKAIEKSVIRTENKMKELHKR